MAATTPPMRRSRLVAMDALNFNHPLHPSFQFAPLYINRELNKAFATFTDLNASSLLGPHRVVATGNWGCGVFGGDLQLKSLLQLMAAAASDIETVVYFCYQRLQLKDELETLRRALGHTSVGTLFRWLMEYEGAKEEVERTASTPHPPSESLLQPAVAEPDEFGCSFESDDTILPSTDTPLNYSVFRHVLHNLEHTSGQPQ
eukprot:NODE_1224_length_1599_cov_35.127038_g1154_i0.p1 GENE.NODE_1224_length_1599_cov_35.127038_g1154_i0~~NODE_1224_length_1599_cov_35.127038_g1154_i0.p1  ORF type:complete len:202 (+),score=41.89 NODE_1224_length_1599_cov_35.127038_g1154_i0:954-1559(+)